jgi:hypothetical protein
MTAARVAAADLILIATDAHVRIIVGFAGIEIPPNIHPAHLARP